MIFLPALIICIASICFAQKSPPKLLQTIPVTNPDMTLERGLKIIPPAYDFSHLHICIDKINVSSLPPKPATPRIPKINSNGDLIPMSSISQGLSGVTEKMWSAGNIISVGFNTGQTTPFVISKVKAYAIIWESFANIKFQFVDPLLKEIIHCKRVLFPSQ